MSVLWWFVTMMGMVQIVVESDLFAPVRLAIVRRSSFFGQMVGCPMCFGVWLGGGLALAGFGSPSLSFVAFPSWLGKLGWVGDVLARLLAALFDGAAASFAAFAWTNVRNYLARARVAAPAPAQNWPWQPAAPRPSSAPPAMPVGQLTRPLPAPEAEPAAPPVTRTLPCAVCPPEPTAEA